MIYIWDREGKVSNNTCVPGRSLANLIEMSVKLKIAKVVLLAEACGPINSMEKSRHDDTHNRGSDRRPWSNPVSPLCGDTVDFVSLTPKNALAPFTTLSTTTAVKLRIFNDQRRKKSCMDRPSDHASKRALRACEVSLVHQLNTAHD